MHSSEKSLPAAEEIVRRVQVRCYGPCGEDLGQSSSRKHFQRLRILSCHILLAVKQQGFQHQLACKSTAHA